MEETAPTLQMRGLWQRLCPNVLLLALLVFGFLSATRVYAYLGPVFNGHLVLLGFFLMWFVPLVFLKREGRRAMGLSLPIGWSWLILGPVVGVGLGYICYLIGDLFYGATENNWYWTIAHSFLSDERVLDMPTRSLFLMFTIPAVLFSPIGEELLFRGFIHQAAQERWGMRAALYLNATLFAGVHLLHHGILKTSDGVEIFWVSGTFWFVLMFLTSAVFTWLRLRFHSLLPSIIAHSCFNLIMNYTIFYLLLPVKS